MRLVVDTNVLVSFAIRPSSTLDTLFDRIAADHVMLVSDATLTELHDVLARDKFRAYLSISTADEYVFWHESLAERVAVRSAVTACRDPRDDKFLALAIDGHAEVIVAGDKDLTALAVYQGIRIMNPAAFVSSIFG